MKLQIRQGVYETNSSSTHSLTMMMKDDYDRWSSSQSYLYTGDYDLNHVENGPVEGHVYTEEETIKFILMVASDEEKENLNNDISDVYSDYGFTTYDDYINGDLETFYDEYTTPNGETVVAFGEYGYDG